MTNAPTECSKCKARIEEGFLLDRSHGTNLASHWVAGPPERSFWTGLKLRGKRLLNVRTFRCVNCGLLESYASH